MDQTTAMMAGAGEERRGREGIAALRYCPDLYVYHRRPTREVMVGEVGVGGTNPIRLQSMLTSDTRDVTACVRETLELADAGCEIVRVTAQTRQIAAELEHIVAGVRAAGCRVPLVADIHFKPDAAEEAVNWVEKVRVNPGNYADRKKFQVREYSDAEYAAELERLADKFLPLVKKCKELGRAMRIGTNHGSLSDRIMNRYGDTPLGMVESALEFARICRGEGYHELIFSMKASNPKVMIEAYRLLAAKLAEAGEDWNYPLHLGVTEAGDGEDGRIKSAIGIGSLLADGLGDTIRVSLTEDSVREVPVAAALALPFSLGDLGPSPVDRAPEGLPMPFDPFCYERRVTERIELGGVGVGGGEPVRVVVPRRVWDELAGKRDELGELVPELPWEGSGIIDLDPTDELAIALVNSGEEARMVTVTNRLALRVIPSFRLLAARLDPRHSILLKDTLFLDNGDDGAGGMDGADYDDGGGESLGFSEEDEVVFPNGCSDRESDEYLNRLIRAATRMGSLLCDGIGDAVMVQGEPDAQASVRLAYNVLQSAGVRIFKTDYVACPSCGRTLFDLQSTTQKIRAATGHLKGVRIAVMGCIVNGPGEMADADFGYVGGAPGKVNLYVGKEVVELHVPEEEAVERLVALIKERGRWLEVR